MSGSLTHVLLESASGYLLFTVSHQEEVAAKSKALQDAITDYASFQRMVQLASFLPFTSAAQALENANDVSEGVLNPHLRSLLNLILPAGGTGKAGKSNKSQSTVVLGVAERGLAGAIQGDMGIACDTGERALELIRGARLHQEKTLEKHGMQKGDVKVAQLGLGHSYSRGKVKFNVNRSDNMIIQAISLSDQLDKDLNTFSMRCREWYGWHFPELYKLVPDAHQYARLAVLIGDRTALTDDALPDIQEILEDDETRARNVLDASRASMGSDIAEVDLVNISNFAERVVRLAEYRASLRRYLTEKMNVVAPNLAALIGETIAARLISHAAWELMTSGSLTNLAKYPASTVQILGAEKALFRALKTKGNTPKYGLIYHSTFIGRAGTKHKGRISRFLANKCSIACRIDCFSDTPTNKFGEALRAQVEERLNFFETGAPVGKNADAIQKALTAIAADLAEEDDEDEDGEPTAEDIAEAAATVARDQAAAAAAPREPLDPELAALAAGEGKSKDKKDKKEKKEKKDKKEKRKSEVVAPEPAAVEAEETEEERKRRKKEKKEKRKSVGGGEEGEGEKKKKKRKNDVGA